MINNQSSTAATAFLPRSTVWSSLLSPHLLPIRGRCQFHKVDTRQSQNVRVRRGFVNPQSIAGSHWTQDKEETKEGRAAPAAPPAPTREWGPPSTTQQSWRDLLQGFSIRGDPHGSVVTMVTKGPQTRVQAGVGNSVMNGQSLELGGLLWMRLEDSWGPALASSSHAHHHLSNSPATGRPVLPTAFRRQPLHTHSRTQAAHKGQPPHTQPVSLTRAFSPLLSSLTLSVHSLKVLPTSLPPAHLKRSFQGIVEGQNEVHGSLRPQSQWERRVDGKASVHQVQAVPHGGEMVGGGVWVSVCKEPMCMHGDECSCSC